MVRVDGGEAASVRTKLIAAADWYFFDVRDGSRVGGKDVYV